MIYVLCEAHAWCCCKIGKSIMYIIQKQNLPVQLSHGNVPYDQVKSGDIFLIINYFPFDSRLVDLDIHIAIFNLDPFVTHSTHFSFVVKHYQNSRNPVYLLDYQSNNIKYFYEHNRNPIFRVLYFPFACNSWILDTFHDYRDRLKTTPKDIDVLMYGSHNLRREFIAQELREKGYNVPTITCHDDLSLFSLLTRSKMVVNVYYYEDNKVFDYYRLAFLLSNDIYVITEDPESVDETVEVALQNFRQYVTTARYDRLVDKIVECFGKSQIERNEDAAKTGTWFRHIIPYDVNLATFLSSRTTKSEVFNLFSADSAMTLVPMPLDLF
jgi:hypothetical protein